MQGGGGRYPQIEQSKDGSTAKRTQYRGPTGVGEWRIEHRGTSSSGEERSVPPHTQQLTKLKHKIHCAGMRIFR
jgi:hypothetical protein